VAKENKKPKKMPEGFTDAPAIDEKIMNKVWDKFQGTNKKTKKASFNLSVLKAAKKDPEFRRTLISSLSDDLFQYKHTENVRAIRDLAEKLDRLRRAEKPLPQPQVRRLAELVRAAFKLLNDPSNRDLSTYNHEHEVEEAWEESGLEGVPEWKFLFDPIFRRNI
jgi:hypothetical protein